ncbi:MAG: FAD-binding oxidoreductase [Chloroflexota bacterium]
MADKSLNLGKEDLDNTKWGHRWGYADTRFIIKPDRSVVVTGNRYAISGHDMPDLVPFVEEMLDITIDVDDLKPERQDKPVPEPIINAAFLKAIESEFPESQYTFDERERLLHSHGQTTADEVYKVLYTSLERVADIVFYVESEGDVVRLIQLAAEHNACLVPYGGGTSVSCALKLPVHEQRMIVSVDMQRMNAIEWIDRENYRASVQAGILGQDLEDKLMAEGFTCGHEPDSVELSTLGGWIATNASGMKKNRYGNIEDIVENVTLVTPKGVVEQLEIMPRVSMGIEPRHIAFGSEGNLGIITRAVIRIHKQPEVKKYGSLVFSDFKTGTDFLYELAHEGVFPASIRLLDNIQFRFGQALKARPTSSEELMGKVQKTYLTSVKGFDPRELCAATIVMEGSAEEVAYQEKVIKRLAGKYGAVSGGEGNGKRGYMLTYAIAYIRDFLTDYHIIGETYETTVPWSRIQEVCDSVAVRALEMHREFGLPGVPYVSPRITQLYQTGVCIYFTHGFSTKGVDHPDEVFSQIEHAMRETILDHGGSISHHHGVGKLRRDFVPETMTPAGMNLIRDIKQATDPDNIFGISNNVMALEPDSPVSSD